MTTINNPPNASRSELSSAVTGYTYDDLDTTEEREEIRLLAFSTSCLANEKIKLSFSIKKCVLYEAPPYCAVSYAWGDVRERRGMEIDGNDVQVPAQAEEALRYLLTAHMKARDDSITHFWIDALCINQANTNERSQQVAIMSEIYANAEQVLVFLGRPFDGHIATMDAITDVASQLRAKYGGDAESMDAALARHTEIAAVCWPPALTDERLLAFYGSRWFTRLWVIQEVGLSKVATAYYGHDAIVMADAIILARWLVKRDYQAGAFRNRTVDRLSRAVDYSKTLFLLRFFEQCESHEHRLGECSVMCYGGISLAWLLQETHDHLNSEPRDKVYAVLGLCTPDISQQIKPDYRLPVSTVYTQATRLACHGDDYLDAYALDASRLARVLGNKPTEWYRQHKWPTWVPLWDEIYDPLVNASGLPWWAFDASESFEARIHEAPLEDPVLKVEGVVVDEIEHISRPFLPISPEETTEELRIDLQNGIGQLSSLAMKAITPAGQSHITALGLTLACGYYPFFGEEYEQGEKHFGAALQHTSLHHLTALLSPTARDDLQNGVGDESKYLLHFRIHSRFRSVFFTRKGYMGLGSQHMLKGDVVCIPFGSTAPWVLRREEGHFLFLGACYVHGIMNGEFVRQTCDEDVRCFEIH